MESMKIRFLGHLWAKNGLLQPPWSLLSNMSNTKTLSFWCLVMMVTKKLEDVDKKLISGQKTHFLAQKGPLWAVGAKKRPAERPNDHLPENQRYPELPQDMGDMWSVRSGASDPKKWGFHRCSVKKCRISGQKCSFLAQNPFFCQKRPTFLLPSWPDNKKTSFLCWPRCTAGLGAAAGARFWPENLHFFTLRLYNPHFFGSAGPDSMGS